MADQKYKQNGFLKCLVRKVKIENANHFIQEDIGEMVVDRTHQFIRKNPI